MIYFSDITIEDFGIVTTVLCTVSEGMGLNPLLCIL